MRINICCIYILYIYIYLNSSTTFDIVFQSNTQPAGCWRLFCQVESICMHFSTCFHCQCPVIQALPVLRQSWIWTFRQRGTNNSTKAMECFFIWREPVTWKAREHFFGENMENYGIRKGILSNSEPGFSLMKCCQSCYDPLLLTCIVGRWEW